MNKTSIEWTDYSSNLIKYHDPEAQVAALKDEVEHLRAVMETWGVR